MSLRPVDRRAENHAEKTSKKYWDSTYEGDAVPLPFDGHRQGLRYRLKRMYHQFFVHAFSTIETKGRELLECGCGGSVLLPYFAKEFDFRVSGIDYSEAGCRLARRVLQEAGVGGKIVCADFFAPPEELCGRFDVVVSFGVAEHFTNTASCIAAFGRLLRPGGLLITSVPNMAGPIGSLQKAFSRTVFDKHVVLDAGSLRRAHETAGLEVRECDYFFFLNLGVLNINEIERGTVEHAVKRVCLQALRVLTAGVWMLEEGFGSFRANRVTSPYIICRAVRPEPGRVPAVPGV